MKRLIMVLAIGVICMFSAICLAEEEHEILQSGDYEYYVNDDDTVTISCWNGEDESVVIPSELDGMKVIVIGYEAFAVCVGLTSIEIPTSVLEIGNYAFDSCDQLTVIVERGSYAADYCKE